MFNNMLSIGKDDVIVVFGEKNGNLTTNVERIKEAFPDNKVVVLDASAVKSLGVIKKEPDMSALMDMLGGSRSNLTTNAAPMFSL